MYNTLNVPYVGNQEVMHAFIEHKVKSACITSFLNLKLFSDLTYVELKSPDTHTDWKRCVDILKDLEATNCRAFFSESRRKVEYIKIRKEIETWKTFLNKPARNP